VKRYMVVDIETTGLNPEKHLLLEVTVLNVKEGVISNRFDAVRYLPELMGSTQAILWHARNGLLEACLDRDNALPTEALSSALTSFLDTNWTHDTPIVVAAKNGWKLDLPFLKADLGIATDTWHHRTIDPAGKLMTRDDEEPPSLIECARRVGIEKPRDDHRSGTGAMLLYHVVEGAWK